jgi:hypothetical protein
MSKQRLAIISYSDLKSDPRVKRQINFFKPFFEITTIGFQDSEIEGVSHLDVSSPLNKWKFILPLPKLLLGLFDSYYWNLGENKRTSFFLNENTFDFIIANDADALPAALKMKGKAKVIFDAHEYSPEENSDSLRWRLLFKRYKTHLIRRFAPQADLMLTVCDGIAEKYESIFGLKPLVVNNAAAFFENENNMQVGSKVKLIHHGLALPQRKIENMIGMMDFVDDRYELDLMLVFRKEEYRLELEKSIGLRKNVRLIPPVATDEIIPFIARYDIGVYLLEPTNFNNKHALPNKFFEFIQARLAIAIGPSPEMVKIVSNYKLGKISPDFEAQSLANTLNSMSREEIIGFKQNSNEAAQVFNAKYNLEKVYQWMTKF